MTPLEEITILKAANQRLQARLDEFKRTNQGYHCRCLEYEYTIDKLYEQLDAYKSRSV